MQLIFASANAHKTAEIDAMMGADFEVLPMSALGFTAELPETQNTFAGNALQKAVTLYEQFGQNCFADDSGLVVDALNGAPGIYSARYAGPQRSHADNNALLLSEMADKTNRKAYFIAVIALIINGKRYLFEGRVEGQIAQEMSGTDGFGYDPIFIPDGFNQTFAQLSPEQKNSMSHRGRAVQAMLAYLKENHKK
jgi:XTP/dITP diphosphohydrolase